MSKLDSDFRSSERQKLLDHFAGLFMQTQVSSLANGNAGAANVLAAAKNSYLWAETMLNVREEMRKANS